MTAISFQPEWVDKLLSGKKQHTTRRQTDRIKVGDVCSLYNQQRRRITDKPLRILTSTGLQMFREGYPFVKPDRYTTGHHTHFLGKVEITEVYDIHPCKMSAEEIKAWAVEDGFTNFTEADTWFTQRYGEMWAAAWWTVIRWDGWLERYFEPEE